MLWLRRWSLIAFVLVLGGNQVLLASTREERAFAAAASAFQDGLWSRAEVEFAEFVEKYTNSDQIAKAILFQAQADYKQGKFLPAIQLLSTHQPHAGNLADQYVYWIGESQFTNQDYAASAATFDRLARSFPDSQWRLDAIVNEASARAKLNQWSQVASLLQEPGGVFEGNAKKNPADERVVRGHLLLAEALLNQNKPDKAADILRAIASQNLAPDLKWQRARLVCRAQLATGDLEGAIASTTNMIRLADLTGQPSMRAQSVVEQGSVLERMGRDQEAQAAYRQNLNTNVPAEWQQQAILKIADLAVAQTNFAEAEQALEKFLTQFPDSPSADTARLSLGELYLKAYVAEPAAAKGISAATNELAAAQACFNQWLLTFTNSPLIGKAYLDRGWCLWLEGKTNAPETLDAFEAAAKHLPPSVDLAVARFKIGDILFTQTNYVGARDNYEAVWQDYTNFPAVDSTLAPQALYQTVRACMQLRDMEGTTNALAQILTVYPTNNLADNTVLLAGEELSDLQKPEAARALFEKFEQLWPNSSLRPQVELALARTYEQQENWPAAIKVYNHWVKQYTNASPTVEYARAMANYQAGNGMTALRQFTNFIARFPNNGLAPLAQWWVGGYFFTMGATNNSYFADAEKNYELLSQMPILSRMPNLSRLAYEAKLMAGRAAMGRYGYRDAINYFASLTADTNCPPNIYVQALFAYGDALKLEPSPDTNDPVANYKQAIQVYNAIIQSYPQSDQAALAWGEKGNCYFQLAGQSNSTHDYDEATNAFTQVINSPQADVSARSQAQTGIGMVFEKLASLTTGQAQTMWLQRALNQYLDVLDTWTGKNLRPGETADPYWVQRAGLEAASVLETLGEWQQAANIYRRLEQILPALHDSLEKKVANAQAHIPSGPPN